MLRSLKSLRHYDGSDTAADTRPVSSRNTNETLKRTLSSLAAKSQGAYKARVVDVWALGITIVIGGQYFNWNGGLSAGFGSYAIATLLIAIAYICLCFCTSELSSALPFAGENTKLVFASLAIEFLNYFSDTIIFCYTGGGYGLARVTLGFYAGFMVGCCEVMEYIIYTADTCLTLNDLIIQTVHIDRKFSPLIWLIFYSSAVTIHCIGGKFFWGVSNILAFLSLTILIMYALGSLKFVDFRNAKWVAYSSVYANSPDSYMGLTNSTYGASSFSAHTAGTGPAWFIGGGTEFMRVLPLAGWMYVGIETLNFASNDVAEVWSLIPCV